LAAPPTSQQSAVLLDESPVILGCRLCSSAAEHEQEAIEILSE
jgi:hypothetical protein